MSSAHQCGTHVLSRLTNTSKLVSVAGNRSRCFVISEWRDIRVNLHCSRCRDGPIFCHRAASSSPHTSLTAAFADHRNGTINDSDSDSDSEHEPNAASDSDRLLASRTASTPILPVSSKSLEPESWNLKDNEDVPTVVSDLSLMERYAPRRLLEFASKKLDLKMLSPAELKSALMFWQKKKKDLQQDTSFTSSAFGEKGVSQIYQWTATELTLQHVRLSRIAHDILYLVLACSLLGIVRILEALNATFSTCPPHLSKLLDAANSLDFFTMAFLAYSVRKPVVGILRVDPTNLDEVVHLKAKIWDEMHKFYERQWKLVATLAVGRLLALITQKLPSTNAMTRTIKMCWDFLLALPIF